MHARNLWYKVIFLDSVGSNANEMPHQQSCEKYCLKLQVSKHTI